MPNFIRHSFSPTDNFPALQFTLDHLAQGQSVQIRLSKSDFPAFFHTISLGVTANILSNGAKVAILSNDDDLLTDLTAIVQKQPWAALWLNFKNKDSDIYLQNIQALKRKTSLKFPLPSNSMRVLQLCAGQIQQHRQAVEKWLNFSHKGKTYTELLTQHLQNYGQTPNPEKISGLNYQFAGNADQLQDLLAKLQEAEHLYQQLGNFQHPLNILNDHFFRQNNLTLAQETAADTLEKVAFVVDAANRDAFTYLFKYEKWIEDHYTEVFAQQNEFISNLLSCCQKGAKLGKFVHNAEKSLSERMGGFLKSITGKNKALASAQNELKTLYAELKKFQQLHNYVPHKFLNLEQEDLTFAQVEENLNLYSQHLSDWFRQKELLIRNHSKRLSRYEVHPHSNYLGLVHQFLSHLDLFAEKLNIAKLFKIQFNFNSENISERIRELEVLQKNINNLRDNWADFNSYFNLKYFWLTLSESEKKLIENLAESGLKNWAYSLESHLSAQQIAQAEANSIPQRASYEKQFGELSRNLAQAKTELKQFILPHWRGLSSELHPQKLAQLNSEGDFNHFLNYYPAICTNYQEWEQMGNSGINFQLIIADIRNQEAFFCQQLNTKTQLVVWIDSEESTNLSEAQTPVWKEQSRLCDDQGKQQIFYEWLAQQLKAQNAEIETFLNVAVAHFGQKIPLLVKHKNKQLAVFADFFTYTVWKDAYIWEIYTQTQLKNQELIFYKTYASAWRTNPIHELTQLLTILS